MFSKITKKRVDHPYVNVNKYIIRDYAGLSTVFFDSFQYFFPVVFESRSPDPDDSFLKEANGMTVNKYYILFRKERHKNRKKLLAALKKQGFDDEDILLIVDAVSGRSEKGKEAISEKILSLLSEGADRQALLGYLDTLKSEFIQTSVR